MKGLEAVGFALVFILCYFLIWAFMAFDVYLAVHWIAQLPITFRETLGGGFLLLVASGSGKDLAVTARS